jgi:hypothetical protein
MARSRKGIFSMKICTICEAEHEENEIEFVVEGIDDGVTWKRYKCLLTGLEFEIWDVPKAEAE